jgi:hypothetical protein
MTQTLYTIIRIRDDWYSPSSDIAVQFEYGNKTYSGTYTGMVENAVAAKRITQPGQYRVIATNDKGIVLEVSQPIMVEHEEPVPPPLTVKSVLR